MEKAESEFKKYYPFTPNSQVHPQESKTHSRSRSLNRDSRKVSRSRSAASVQRNRNEHLTPKESERIYQRLMQQEKLKQVKLNKIREIQSSYDVETGQKLYTPKIQSISDQQEIIQRFRSKPDIRTEQYFVKNCTEFMTKCRQIFDFLDIDKDSAIYSSKLTIKRIHPNTFKLINCILVSIIQYENMEGPGLSFPLFYKMIRENKLEEEIMEIFFVIQAQPEIYFEKSSRSRSKKSIKLLNGLN